MPVDLVGHDWGSLLVQRVVSLRPDLIRTWACGNGPVDTEYVWHDMAQQWQTPGGRRAGDGGVHPGGRSRRGSPAPAFRASSRARPLATSTSR